MAKLFAGSEEPISYCNSFADSTPRFSLDALLRSYGFRIKFRKHGQEPVWERQGDEFRQRDALRTIPNEKIAEARKAENRYYESEAKR